MRLAGWLTALTVLATVPWWPRRSGAGRRLTTGRRLTSGRRTAQGPGGVGPALLMDLTAAALQAGASVPGALRALGCALGERTTTGAALHRAGTLLVLGADWAEAWRPCPPRLAALADALEPAWTDGADPLPLLERAAAAHRADRHREAQEAAARLGVHLVLPLGLCFLPAFVLLGLVPVLLSAGSEVLSP